MVSASVKAKTGGYERSGESPPVAFETGAADAVLLTHRDPNS